MATGATENRSHESSAKLLIVRDETDGGRGRFSTGVAEWGKGRLRSLRGSRYEKFASNRVRVDLDEHIDDLNVRLIELTTRVEHLENRLSHDAAEKQ